MQPSTYNADTKVNGKMEGKFEIRAEAKMACNILWIRLLFILSFAKLGTRTRTNTNPNDTEANAAGRSGNARALRKHSKFGVNHDGEGHWPKFSQKS